MDIITLEEKHFPTVAQIYLQGIEIGNATFQTTAPSWHDWNKSHLQHSRLVAIVDKEIAG